jgi:hypothetical protein
MMEKRQHFQHGKVDITCRKLKVDPCLSLRTSMNSKWIKNINRRTETWKLVQVRVENTLELVGKGISF